MSPTYPVEPFYSLPESFFLRNQLFPASLMSDMFPLCTPLFFKRYHIFKQASYLPPLRLYSKLRTHALNVFRSLAATAYNLRTGALDTYYNQRVPVEINAQTANKLFQNK